MSRGWSGVVWGDAGEVWAWGAGSGWGAGGVSG
ncbi:methanol dehydrogenase, partial [Streptosporangium nondiastaticum]